MGAGALSGNPLARRRFHFSKVLNGLFYSYPPCFRYFPFLRYGENIRYRLPLENFPFITMPQSPRRGLGEYQREQHFQPVTKEQTMSINLVKQWFPQLPSALERAPMAGLLCAAALLLGVVLALARPMAPPNAANTPIESKVLSRDSGAEEPSIETRDLNRSKIDEAAQLH
jgi:hypothetical protein